MRENEQFHATFIQAVRLAKTTASADKKKLLQNAIINSAMGQVDETVRLLFVQMLDRLTPMHAPTPNNFGISEISLDGEVETGISRFGPAFSEGRFAIVTDVGGGMRWTRAAR